jgi:hypothetical protein
MGLDMYLIAERFFIDRHSEGRHPKRSEAYQLGYWRKHPNRHGFIVQTFADGVDECQPISLGADDIERIMQAVRDKALPHTTGFSSGRVTARRSRRIRRYSPMPSCG